MRKIIYAAVAGALSVAAAFALPAELVVLSDKEVRPDEAAGLYYLGTCEAGYLYNGSAAAIGRAAPYRILDRDAQLKDYYIVWAPEWVAITPEDFAHLGTAVRLSDTEILVGFEPGLGPEELRAVEHRIELIKLEPVTRVDWQTDGEEPPKKKDPIIEAAVGAITEAEYAGYIRTLQGFKTRRVDTKGCDAARDYIRGFFSAQGLDTSLFEFDSVGFKGAYYDASTARMYVRTDHSTIKRSKDNGSTWDTIYAEGTHTIASLFWYDAYTGFIGANNNRIAKTADGGETWETITFASGYPEHKYKAYSICFTTPEIGWLGGDYQRNNEIPTGFLAKTTDGGRNWTPWPAPGGARIGAMGFYDVNHGWAWGLFSDDRIFYTANGGESWQEGSLPGGVGAVNYIKAVSPNEAWATSGRKDILHTTDGLAWSWVDVGASRPIYRIAFPDSQYGYAAGKELFATSDGGATWRQITGFPTGACFALSFADSDHGVLGDHSGAYLLRTDNGCASFTDIVDNVDISSENVIGERRGSAQPKKIVIICGHYDSISDMLPSLAPGAEDNASGTACVLAAARALRGIDFPRTVRYIAFSAEEDAVVGSTFYARYCAERRDDIVAVLNADMVCYDEDGGHRDDYAVDYGRDKWLFDYLKAVGGLYGNDLIYELGVVGSDEKPFRLFGYPAMAVIEGSVGPGGCMVYPYYHTTEDTLDKLHPALGVRFARDYAAMFAHLAAFDDTGVNEPRPGGAAVPFARPFSVYPNPFCYATSTGGVNFVGVRSPATVEIYDLAGRRVGREEVAVPCDECVWRPARVGGEALSPGVYLYRVEGQGQRKAGKIVIAR